MSKESVSFDGRRLDVDMDSYLSKHDVVYLTPEENGCNGFPLGNGDMGTMVWTAPKAIHCVINKCDTWDDMPEKDCKKFGASDPPSPEEYLNLLELEEHFTSLRSCGELLVEPGLPVFDWMYIEDFEARLSLAEARATISARGPFGKVECEIFVAREPRVLVLKYRDNLAEPTIRRVKLARWGSRVFEHWYHQFKRESLLGPAGTRAGCSRKELWIEQPTRTVKFATACRLDAAESRAKVSHSRQAEFEIAAGKSCRFSLMLTAFTSEEAEAPLSAARRTLREAARAGRAKIFRRHRKYWKDFWSKSFINLSEDYLENLWYIDLYQLGSSSLGKYPPHFIGSLWSWNRDVKPWTHYYHWNQQFYTWPLHASGHPELMLPYARWRLEGLPLAKQHAKRHFKCRGAVYDDISNRKGCQCFGDWNLTPGAQMSLDLWRHYEYTLDAHFLEKYAYPIMRETVRFYLDYLKKGKDGRYHVPKASPYESELVCKDTTNDLAHIRRLFPAFSKAAGILSRDMKLRKKAMEVLECLAEYVYTTLPKNAHTWCDVPTGTKIGSCGIDLRTGKPAHFWTKGPHGECGYHVANAQLAAVYPTGLVGLDQKGTEEFKVLSDTLCCFNPEGNHGHTIMLIALARMGLGDLLGKALKKWPKTYQLFSQGLFCYFKRNYSEEEIKRGLGNRSHHTDLTLTNRVRALDTSPTEYVDLPRRPFAHMALEAGSLLQAAINEMLLQSHGGTIRVFPAMPRGWEGKFTLHATGGFVVTSEMANGRVKYIAVRSTLGGACSVINPWGKKKKARVMDYSANRELSAPSPERQISFDTKRGSVYVIERTSAPLSTFRKEMLSGTPNTGPKKFGEAIIGKPRQF